MSLRILFAAIALACIPSSAAWTDQEPERFLLYKVERISDANAPQVDGRLDEPVWQDRAAIASLRNFLGPLTGELASQRSEFILLTTGPALYIAATFYDDDMEAVRHNPAKDPFWNDCTELYFDPRHDGTRSIQLVVDVGGGRYWEKRFDDGYGWWVDRSWYMLARWSAAVARGADRWTVELELDCASFGINSAPGSVCGFNPCRFRLGAQQQEFSAWGFGGDRRQKNMAAWGHLLFLPPGQSALGAPVTRADLALVYPDLGNRVIEVPVEGGFAVFTAQGEKSVTFAEILAPLQQQADARLAETSQALAALPDDSPNAPGLREKLAPLTARHRDLTTRAAAPLTLGACDRLSEDLARLDGDLHDLLWKARLAELALRAARE